MAYGQIQAIALPIRLVSGRAGATCHLCENAPVLVYSHSHVAPDMEVCFTCLASHGMSSVIKEKMAQQTDVWKRVARLVGHDV